MRKFLVKHFVLNYSFTIGKTRFTALRASRIIFPIFVLAGVLTLINPLWPALVWYTGLGYSLVTLAVWFGFFHWEFFPAKWDEMDDDQKWQYGFAVKSMQVTKPKDEYKDINWTEWELLNKERHGSIT